jgi:hypothetical protein
MLLSLLFIFWTIFVVEFYDFENTFINAITNSKNFLMENIKIFIIITAPIIIPLMLLTN